MDLHTITEICQASAPALGGGEWRHGDSWLAGGTWLFSEPQPSLRRLVDLDGFRWEPLATDEHGLHIAATCTIAELLALPAPPEWLAGPLIGQCADSFLASFKVWNTATVGGNICMSLPAGPMISLAVALEATYVIWLREGGERQVAAEDFTTGDNENVLGPGDLLRSIDVPTTALRKRTSLRRMSLTKLGRSTALLIGTAAPDGGAFDLTVTASTRRPLRVGFDRVPSADDLRRRLRDAIPDALYHDDVHGAPDYRRHLTFHFAEEIRQELSADQATGGSQP